MHFDVKGWNSKIDKDIFEEPENQRVLANDNVPKKMISTQNRLYMAMQGCIFMLRVGAQKVIDTFLRSSKIARNFGLVYFAQKVFFKIKICLSVMRIVFQNRFLGILRARK